MKYYVLAPANFASGGPELAHQMCSELLALGRDAKMYYVNGDNKNPIDGPCCNEYRKYNTDHVNSMEEIEQQDSVVIFNEGMGMTHWLKDIHCGKKILWWMSVDNYYTHETRENLQELLPLLDFHLVQCEYAYEHVKGKLLVPEEKIIRVSDYINEEYGTFLLPAQYRQDIALYNPKKGFDEIEPVILKTSEWLKWIPLINLTPEKLMILMQSAKVYVDFGTHPGKDRIPRESAVNGCCVITNRKGSAAYFEDVPIPEKYKLQDIKNHFDELIVLLRSVCQNYAEDMKDFGTYREWIKGEHERFKRDVRNMIEIIEK